MKNIDNKIQEAVAQVDLRKPESVRTAANAILTEELYVGGGDTVGIIDDPTYGFPAQKVKVVGPSNKGSGWVDVELVNGTKIPVQSSLLVKVPK